MIDSLQMLIWGITYIIMIIASFQSRAVKCVPVPYLAGVLNISWEICACVKSGGFWGHVLWLGLDIIIVGFSIYFLTSNKSKNFYVVKTFCISVIFSYLFTFTNGQLYLSYVINIIMSIWYILDREDISTSLKTTIAAAKMIGTAIGGIYYAQYSNAVFVMVIIIYISDMIYFSMCIMEKYEKKANYI